MNLRKINQYAKHSSEVHRPSKIKRSYQYFNPISSELFHMTGYFKNVKACDGRQMVVIELNEISYYKAGQTHFHDANCFKHFRSFVLGMLKGGLNISYCKDYKAAKRLSNFGGVVVLVKNQGKARQWGVVR